MEHDPSMTESRLNSQVSFLLSADGLKDVIRRNRILDGSRLENSAEHTWHLTLMAMTLSEHAHEGTDISHVIELLVIHDLVEIHAGDHWPPPENAAAVEALESEAARKIFSVLPQDQGARMQALWREFEDMRTPEAQFAKALDALHPLILIWGPGGIRKAEIPLSATRLIEIKRPVIERFPTLWNLVRGMLEEAVADGKMAAE